MDNNVLASEYGIKQIEKIIKMKKCTNNEKKDEQ
jgi:hypothetical protein